MVQNKKIEDALLHLIGFDQEELSGISVDELTKSESGLYFQQAHPLITLTNLSSIAPDYQKFGDSSIFSAWLERKVRASITKAINRFVIEKLSNKTTNSLCENKTLFDGTGRLTDTILNRNNLVGFEIVPIRSKGITTRINKIGLQFTAPGTYKLYLMHSSSIEPVKIIELEKTAKGSQWINVDDLLLPYQGEYTDAGGSWYLCYKQSELPKGSLAINKDKDWSKGPCRSCSRSEYQSWSAWSKYIEIHPFEIKEELVEDLDGSVIMWDVENNNYQYDHNYGLNLDLSVYCDLTDFIIQERHLFQDIILKQFAIDMLREFAYNPNVRTNRHSINASRMDILYEIDGDSSSLKKSGLSYQLEQALKAVNVSTEGIDRVCLPCKNNGIKYRVV